MTLINLFEESIKKYGEKRATTMRPRYRTISFTYDELGKYASSIRNIIEREGVGRGDRVMLYAANSPYWVGAFWGVISQGAVIVPIHTENTKEFIEKVYKETQAKVILKDSAFDTGLKNTKEINIDEVELSSEISRVEKVGAIEKDDVAEIVYTSGTTGDPKGVVLTHGNITSNVEASFAERVPITSEDKFLSILPLSHMFEQTAGMLFPLSRGAEIVYVPRISSGIISKTMREHGITKMIAVPRFLHLLIKKIESRAKEEGKYGIFKLLLRIAEYLPIRARRLLFFNVHEKLGGHLEVVASGGAPLDKEIEKKWELLGTQVLQGYGLTETSPVVSTNTFEEKRFGSVGKAINGVNIKLAPDKEILVKGPNVFKGYYKNDEKTKEAFTSDGWFKTGDMGDIDKDGFLFIRGRKKYMILGPSGQNVYPEDIESKLNEQAEVKDSAVVGLPVNGSIEIHAVLLLEDGAEPESIIRKANESLASFQQIQDYSIWKDSNFPRSATRKVKKEEVLTWIKNKSTYELGNEREESTPLTKILSEIFEKKEKEITEDTRLSGDLGMDSILRIELVTRIEESFGVRINESKITSQTSVKDIRQMIEKSPRSPDIEMHISEWQFSESSKSIRKFCQRLLIEPFFNLFMKVSVLGEENIKKIDGPFIIMVNHLSYLDSPAVLASIPRDLRNNISFATATGVMKKYWYWRPLLKTLYGAFDLPTEEGENIEPGLKMIGKLLDRGQSVVIYPEGQLNETGKLMPLKRGTGLVAIEMQVPIIPLYISGTDKIVPPNKIFPRRAGEIKVSIGEPLTFKKGAYYDEATKTITEHLEKLEQKTKNEWPKNR